MVQHNFAIGNVVPTPTVVFRTTFKGRASMP
jgi:hypothetical protein